MPAGKHANAAPHLAADPANAAPHLAPDPANAAPPLAPQHMTQHHYAAYTAFTEAMRMDDAQRRALSYFFSSKFRTRWSRTQIQSQGREEYFAFWGFMPNELLRNKLLALVSYVFKTRIIVAASTRQTMFECVCVVDGTITTMLAKHFPRELPASTEDQLVWFLELFNMSADVVRFEKILNVQMVSSIDRVELAQASRFGNLLSPAASDFYELYRVKRAWRDDSTATQMLTGYELSKESVCHLSLALKSHERRARTMTFQIENMQGYIRSRDQELRDLSGVKAELLKSDAAREKTGRLVLALHVLGEVSTRTKKLLLAALGLCTLSPEQFSAEQGGARESSRALVKVQEILVRDDGRAASAHPEDSPKEPRGPVTP